MAPGIPESFRILVNELQSLGLKVTVEDEQDQRIDLRDNEDEMDSGESARRRAARRMMDVRARQRGQTDWREESETEHGGTGHGER